MQRQFASLAALALLAACAPATSHVTPNGARAMPAASLPLIPRVSGCYFLEDGAWQQDAALDRFTPRTNMPRHFEFEVNPFPGADAAHSDSFPVLRVRTTADRHEAYFEYWQPSRQTTDGFHTGFFLPMSGAIMELRATSLGLTGTLSTFSDAVDLNAPPFPSAAVTLRPETCEWGIPAVCNRVDR